jgi:hypothetical protein
MTYCPKCGRQATSAERFCSSCGQELPQDTGGFYDPDGPRRDIELVSPPPPAGATGGDTPPDNHLAKAIISTILCCLPLGIVAIVYASSVNGKFMAGDIAGAREASRNASNWGNWSIGAGLVGGILYFLFVVVLGFLDS